MPKIDWTRESTKYTRALCFRPQSHGSDSQSNTGMVTRQQCLRQLHNTPEHSSGARVLRFS